MKTEQLDLQSIADLKEFPLFCQAARSVCQTREEWKSLKRSLEGKVTDIGVQISKLEMEGRDGDVMRARQARHHAVDKMRWVDEKLSSFNQQARSSGHWIMWVESRVEGATDWDGWVPTDQQPVDWLLSQDDPQGYRIGTCFHLTDEQFQSLPESITKPEL